MLLAVSGAVCGHISYTSEFSSMSCAYLKCGSPIMSLQSPSVIMIGHPCKWQQEQIRQGPQQACGTPIQGGGACCCGTHTSAGIL